MWITVLQGEETTNYLKAFSKWYLYSVSVYSAIQLQHPQNPQQNAFNIVYQLTFVMSTLS